MHYQLQTLGRELYFLRDVELKRGDDPLLTIPEKQAVDDLLYFPFPDVEQPVLGDFSVTITTTGLRFVVIVSFWQSMEPPIIRTFPIPMDLKRTRDIAKDIYKWIREVRGE